MFSDLSLTTEEEIDALSMAITDAIKKVTEGVFISLSKLETRADKVCEAILKLPSDIAKKLSNKLEDLVKDLDTLRTLMLDQLTAINFKNSLAKRSR